MLAGEFAVAELLLGEVILSTGSGYSMLRCTTSLGCIAATKSLVEESPVIEARNGSLGLDTMR